MPNNIAETFGLGKGNTQKNVALFGVECEIESCDLDETPCGDLTDLEIKEDNSLRNDGKEFVWVGPKPLKHSTEMFQNLHTTLRVHNREHKFSERTSTHVHVNCRGLSTDETRTLVLLYALYEELFFLCVDKERRDNIFCVALTDTHLPAIYYSDINGFVSRWSKYTALNLKRLTDLGTVEFRHMQGTEDALLFTQWLTLLETLFHLSQKVTLTKDTLTEENIQHWADTLFSHFGWYKYARGDVFNIIENSLIDIKLSFV